MTNKWYVSTDSYYKKKEKKIRTISIETKKKIFIASFFLFLATGIGYGLSFVIPDSSIRKNIINNDNINFLLYDGEQLPTNITKEVTRGYSKEDIEATYAYNYKLANLDGLDARVSNTPKDDKETNDAYISNVQRDREYVKISDSTDNNIYLVSGTTNNDVTLTDVTSLYFKKSTFLDNTLYTTKGTSTFTILKQGTSSHFLKSDFQADNLYLATGVGDDITLSLVTNNYWKKDSFSPGRIYSLNTETDGSISRSDVTNEYFLKSDFIQNHLYAGQGSGNGLVLQDTNDYIKLSTFNKENYLYVGSEDEDPTILKVSKEVTGLDRKLKFYDASRQYANHPDYTFNTNQGFTMDLLELINVYMPDYAKITPEEFVVIINNLGTKYRFKLFISDTDFERTDRVWLVDNWTTERTFALKTATSAGLLPETSEYLAAWLLMRISLTKPSILENKYIFYAKSEFSGAIQGLRVELL